MLKGQQICGFHVGGPRNRLEKGTFIPFGLKDRLNWTHVFSRAEARCYEPICRGLLQMEIAGEYARRELIAHTSPGYVAVLFVY